MLVDEFGGRGRGGVLRHNKLVKWGFYSELYEEFLAYTDDDETNTCFEYIPLRGTSDK